MGLSASERIHYAVNAITELKHHIDPPDLCVWRDPQDFRGLLDKVKEQCSQAAGLLAQQLSDRDDGLQAVVLAGFYPEDPDSSSATARREDQETDLVGLDLLEFARRAHFDHSTQNIAWWWHLWQEHIELLLYAMNRYDDGMFRPEFRTAVNRLLSAMLDLRHFFEVPERTEQVLLLKYQVFRDRRFETRFPFTELLRSIEDMTQDALMAYQWERTKATWDNIVTRTSKYDHVDPVYGAIVTPEQRVEEVAQQVEKEVGKAPERSFILRALVHFQDDVQTTQEFLAVQMKKMLQLQNQGEVPEICDGCHLVVLDKRNKSGYCTQCYREKMSS